MEWKFSSLMGDVEPVSFVMGEDDVLRASSGGAQATAEDRPDETSRIAITFADGGQLVFDVIHAETTMVMACDLRDREVNHCVRMISALIWQVERMSDQQIKERGPNRSAANDPWLNPRTRDHLTRIEQRVDDLEAVLGGVREQLSRLVSNDQEGQEAWLAALSEMPPEKRARIEHFDRYGAKSAQQLEREAENQMSQLSQMEMEAKDPSPRTSALEWPERGEVRYLWGAVSGPGKWQTVGEEILTIECGEGDGPRWLASLGWTDGAGNRRSVQDHGTTHLEAIAKVEKTVASLREGFTVEAAPDSGDVPRRPPRAVPVDLDDAVRVAQQAGFSASGDGSPAASAVNALKIGVLRQALGGAAGIVDGTESAPSKAELNASYAEFLGLSAVSRTTVGDRTVLTVNGPVILKEDLHLPDDVAIIVEPGGSITGKACGDVEISGSVECALVWSEGVCKNIVAKNRHSRGLDGWFISEEERRANSTLRKHDAREHDVRERCIVEQCLVVKARLDEMRDEAMRHRSRSKNVFLVDSFTSPAASEVVAQLEVNEWLDDVRSGAYVSNSLATTLAALFLIMLAARTGKKPEQEATDLGGWLVGKHRAYGGSVMHPIGLFSKELDLETSLYVRLDDKLSRIKNGHEYPGDDTIKDVAGYLVLLLAVRAEREAVAKGAGK